MKNKFTSSNYKKLRQQGFTLLELVIVLALISVLAGLSIFAYDGSRGQGIALYSTLTQYGDALKRMRVDTQCYPENTAALFDRRQAGTSYCGSDLRQNWKGPYTQAAQNGDNQAGHIDLMQYTPTSYLSLPDRSGAGFGAGDINDSGNRFQWSVVANNIPADIVNVVMEECNNGYETDALTTFKRGQCFIIDGEAPSGAAVPSFNYDFIDDGQIRSVGYIFDERA
jgi:prepilin-type N-terminal cleavage/methylation domain-containing protein